MDESWPPLAALRQKRNKIASDKNEIAAKAHELRQILHANAPSATNSNNRVAQILGIPTRSTGDETTRELQETLRDLEAYNNALDMLDSQISAEETRASRAICEKLKPEHDKRVKEFGKKLVELYEAHRDYEQFIDEANANLRTIGSLNPIHISALGSTSDPSGSYFWGFREFTDAGHLPTSAVPDTLK